MATNYAVLTDLLRLLDALRHPKAIVLLMASFAIAILLMGAGAASNALSILGLCAVLAPVIVLVVREAGVSGGGAVHANEGIRGEKERAV